MKTRIIFRADGGTDVGMGHVVRSLALAEMLKSEFTIVFAIKKPEASILSKIKSVTQEIIVLPETTDMLLDVSEFKKHLKKEDVVVLDGYLFKTEYQKEIKSIANKLVVIDDLHAWHQVADVVINYADNIKLSDYSAEPYTEFCLGLDYVLLRMEFFRNPVAKSSVKNIKKVLISMGASDIHNLTKKYSEALCEIAGIEEIHLLLGSVNKKADTFIEETNQAGNIKIVRHIDIPADELVKLISNCDLAVCPASTISLECCAVGIPLISGFTSDNQLGILESLKAKEVVINTGDLISNEIENFKSTVMDLIKDPEKMNRMLSQQKKLIDGKSPQRYLELFRKLTSPGISFRFANESDIDTYFNWANDPLVRNNSFNQNKVDYDAHVKWFLSKLKSADCYFYFFEMNNLKVGQVRIDKSGEEIVIGISIDEAFRGRSAGTEMLKSACNDYLVKNPEAEIVAYIKKENVSSYSIFKKAGFGNESSILHNGIPCYRLSLKLNRS